MNCWVARLGVQTVWADLHLFIQNQKIFLITGLCGGFTTFSAFAHENQLFLKSGDYLLLTAYTFGSIFIGILAVIGGVILAKQI